MKALSISHTVGTQQPFNEVAQQITLGYIYSGYLKKEPKRAKQIRKEVLKSVKK